MKREGIRRRQKTFLTFLLAVIIGILPTVEVWATEYKLEAVYNSATDTSTVTFDNEIMPKNTDFSTKIIGGADRVNTEFTSSPDGSTFVIKYVDNNGKLLAETASMNHITGTIVNTLGPANFTNTPGDYDNNWTVQWANGSSGGEFHTLRLESNTSFTINGTPINGTAHNIYYTLNGGQFAPGSEIAQYGEGITLILPEPTQAGFTFAGWTNDADGTAWTGVKPTDNTDIYITAHWTSNFTPVPDPEEEEPEPESHVLTFIPNTGLDSKFSRETTSEFVTLPQCNFQSYPGQMFAGWQITDSIEAPYIGKGILYKEGSIFSVNRDTSFIAVWKDNPTFRIDCPDEFELTPPDNNQLALERLVRKNMKITYYSDGVDPTNEQTNAQSAYDDDPSPTPIPERQIYDAGDHIPASDLEIVISDPKLYRKIGTFDAKIIYKGLYKRTLEKTVSVTVLDPNDPTFGTFDITDIEELGPVTVTYPDSIACHGSKWKQAKSYVSIACDTMPITTKKVKTSDMEEVKAGQSGEIIKIKGKISKNDDLDKEEAKKLGKKLNKKIKKHINEHPLKIAICPLIVMPEMLDRADVKNGVLKSVSIMLEDKTKIIIKPDDFTVDEVNQVVTFSGNYGGNLTFEELGLIVPTPSPVPVPSNVPTNK